MLAVAVPVKLDLNSYSKTSSLLSPLPQPRMADDPSTVTPQGSRSSTRPIKTGPTPSEAIVSGWRSSLRQQNGNSTQQQQQQARPTVPHLQPQYRASSSRSRPPSGVSSSNRLSSNPSLLSLEQPPLSPTTTVASRYPYSSSSTSLPSSSATRQPPPPPLNPPRSPSSSQHPHQFPLAHSRQQRSFPPQGGRHAAQLHKVYDKPRYDADYDRGSNKLPVSTASAPALFNPDAPRPQPQPQPQSSTTSVGSFGPERRRERELREDGTARKPRSKREVVDPQDLGRRAGGGASGVKESQDSLDSVETDFSGRTKSSSGGRRRRRREGDGDGEGEGGEAGAASRRQLFDPRRDDPTRFNSNGSASHDRLPVPPQRANSRAASAADNRSIAGQSIASFNSAYSGTSDVTGVEVDDSASINTTNSGRPTANDPALANLKRAYREIMDLEKRLQDEHRAAMVAKDKEDDEQNVGKGVRLHGATKSGNGSGKYDDEYWVRLANGHKQ